MNDEKQRRKEEKQRQKENERAWREDWKDVEHPDTGENIRIKKTDAELSKERSEKDGKHQLVFFGILIAIFVGLAIWVAIRDGSSPFSGW